MPDQPDSQKFLPRERLYVDANIQMRMLVALVVLEVLLAIGGVGYLYVRFLTVIENNLYRIHHTAQDFFSVLLDETGWVMLFMLVINVVGLLIADRFWVSYVRRVLGTFTSLADKVADLDFRPDSESKDLHASLDLMLVWRQKERSRMQAARSILENLSTGEQLVAQLQELRRDLPPYSRRFLGRKVHSSK